MAGLSSTWKIGPSDQGKRCVALTAAITHLKDSGASFTEVLALAEQFERYIEHGQEKSAADEQQ